MANKLDNLKKAVPFTKNDPRINKEGRPKKLPELDRLLADVLGEEKDGISAAEAILKALRAKATKGDIRAAEVLLERAWGKAKQQVDLTSGGEKMSQMREIVIMPASQRKNDSDAPS